MIQVDKTARGERIRKVVQQLVAARAPVARAELVGGDETHWLADVFTNLMRAGVILRHRGAPGGGLGNPSAFEIANWPAAEKIVDEKNAAAIYDRWVVHPPSRKLNGHNGNGHAPVAPASAPIPPPVAPPQPPTRSPLSAAALGALKTLWREGVL